MTNKELLKSKMALHGDTVLSLADKLGLSRVYLNQLINNTGGREFRQSHIQSIIDTYQLTPQEIVDIFFKATD